MFKRRSIRLAVTASLGVFLVSCGSSDAEWQEYAKAKKMSEAETTAFLSCTKASQRNWPVFTGADGKTVMKSTPLAVCACQAKSIMSVFIEKEYRTYTTFAEYMGKEVKKNPPRWSKKLLKEGVDPGKAGKRLEASLVSCVSSYVAAHKDLDPPLLQPLPVKEAEKKPEAAS